VRIGLGATTVNDPSAAVRTAIGMVPAARVIGGATTGAARPARTAVSTIAVMRHRPDESRRPRGEASPARPPRSSTTRVVTCRHVRHARNGPTTRPRLHLGHRAVRRAEISLDRSMTTRPRSRGARKRAPGRPRLRSNARRSHRGRPRRAICARLLPTQSDPARPRPHCGASRKRSAHSPPSGTTMRAAHLRPW
jgi:hypothetical protein